MNESYSKIFDTLFTGKTFVKLTEIDSTNNFLKTWISNNTPIEGTVILADYQSAGRGQKGTDWQSASGENITMSLLYLPKFLRATEQFELSMMVSWSIYQLLREILPEQHVEIKWPNDLMVNRKKICGILIENGVVGKYLSHSIIGIGLNVGQSNFDSIQATSVNVLGGNLSLQAVLAHLLKKLEINYLKLNQEQKTFQSEYESVLLGKDEELFFSDEAGEFKGVIQGIETDGRLIIRTSQGLRYFYHKEVKFLL